MADKIRYRESAGLVAKVRAVGQASSPHEDFYHYVLSRSWGAFFGVLGLLYLAVNVAFAALYLLVPGSIQGARPGSFEDAFFFSAQTLSTVGYGALSPANRYANALVVIESFTGLLATAMVTGVTFSKFARPRARVLFSKNLVVHRRDGVAHLEVRMANWRHNQILEAEVKMLLLVNEISREGESLRRQIELPLVRDRSAFFWLTFTVMHPIVEGSPFHGEGAFERLKARDATLLVTIHGLDETLSQEIHARCLYQLDDVVRGARFADVIGADPDGTRVVDYTRFHDVLPQDDAKPSLRGQGRPARPRSGRSPRGCRARSRWRCAGSACRRGPARIW